jgi:DnaJ-class molecular chaperone
MKKEVRQKMINYDVFISDDGKEFDTKKEALLHDRLIRGEIKMCPECKGTGKVEEWEEWENYHTGMPERSLLHVTCQKCNGKGYLEKKTVWQ